MIKIKDFANETGFSIRMLRYLEDMELLTPKRDDNNYRLYAQEQIPKAIIIKSLQDLGIQLKEIGVLLIEKETSIKLQLLEKILNREIEIAEMKSDSIPKLRELITFIKE